MNNSIMMDLIISMSLVFIYYLLHYSPKVHPEYRNTFVQLQNTTFRSRRMNVKRLDRSLNSKFRRS